MTNLMTNEEKIQSVLGSCAIEGMVVTQEDHDIGLAILEGRLSVDEAIARVHEELANEKQLSNTS